MKCAAVCHLGFEISRGGGGASNPPPHKRNPAHKFTTKVSLSTIFHHSRPCTTAITTMQPESFRVQLQVHHPYSLVWLFLAPHPQSDRSSVMGALHHWQPAPANTVINYLQLYSSPFHTNSNIAAVFYINTCMAAVLYLESYAGTMRPWLGPRLNIRSLLWTGELPE